MTNPERDDAMIAEVAEMFPPDTVDVQSRYVIVHQLRASADIQDAQTKRETGWADTSDRACLMRKAADALDALLAKLQPAPKPDRAKVLARMIEGLFAEAADNPCTCASDENSCPHRNAWERATKQTRACIVEAFAELRAKWEAERPAVVAPEDDWSKGKEDCDGNELVTFRKDDLVKQMVTRFLGWKLPEDFHPDDGISFEPFFNIEWNAKQGKPPQRRTPTGTNLFSYTQAEAMVRFILADFILKGDQ